MDRRRQGRVAALIPVTVWGVDAHANAFTQTATVRNISSSGAVLQGIPQKLKQGQVLDVQFENERAQFRVVWAGLPGTYEEGEIGLERIDAEFSFWHVEFERCQPIAQA